MQDLMEWVDNGGDDEDIQEMKGEDDQDRVSEDAVAGEEDGTIDNEVEQTRPQKHRKTLTRSRNVNSIYALLNEDNFEPIDYVNGNGMWKTLTGFLGPKSNKNTQTIEWQREIVEHMSFVLQFLRWGALHTVLPPFWIVSICSLTN